MPLTFDVRSIVQQYGLKRSGNGFTGRCPSCDYPSGFAVRELHGKILFYCHTGGCKWQEITSAIQQHGGWVKSDLPIAAPKHAQGPDIKIELACILWGKAIPAAGTLAESYLASRGITLAIPEAIRFLERCKHPTGVYFPAMVTAITGQDGQVCAVHRTFITRDGSDKAPVEPNKMTLGPLLGSAARLGSVQEKLLVAEGLENALTVAQEMGTTCWAGLSAAGLAAMELPPQVREVTICADPDIVGIQAARKAAERWISQGRAVEIAKPPQGALDFNDVIAKR